MLFSRLGYKKQKMSIPYHVQNSKHFIQTRLLDKQVIFKGSYKSYISGLKFHHNVEKPSQNRIYLCLPLVKNKKKLGVYAKDIKIGFVPKGLPFELDSDSTIILCYCTGRTTKLSSQCFYNVFKVIDK
jgi:hypothetical protein